MLINTFSGSTMVIIWEAAPLRILTIFKNQGHLCLSKGPSLNCLKEFLSIGIPHFIVFHFIALHRCYIFLQIEGKTLKQKDYDLIYCNTLWWSGTELAISLRLYFCFCFHCLFHSLPSSVLLALLLIRRLFPTRWAQSLLPGKWVISAVSNQSILSWIKKEKIIITIVKQQQQMRVKTEVT